MIMNTMQLPTSTIYTRTVEGDKVILSIGENDYSDKAETLKFIKKYGFKFQFRTKEYSIYKSNDLKYNYIKIYHY